MAVNLNRIRVSEYEIPSPVSLTFAFVSDLHDCDNAPVIDRIRQISPDAVLVGGDFIHNTSIFKRGIEFLSLVGKSYPTFYSLGNHEMKFNGDLFAYLSETDAVLLDDRAVDFRGVRIGGLTSGYALGGPQGHIKATPAPNLKWLEEFSREDLFKILLSHHPEYYPRYIRQTTVNITLSGHAHGGQWRFFKRGVFAPGQGLFPKYTSGMYDGRLIVGRGLGNPHFIPRIFNDPELIVLRLIRQED